MRRWPRTRNLLADPHQTALQDSAQVFLPGRSSLRLRALYSGFLSSRLPVYSERHGRGYAQHYGLSFERMLVIYPSSAGSSRRIVSLSLSRVSLMPRGPTEPCGSSLRRRLVLCFCLGGHLVSRLPLLITERFSYWFPEAKERELDKLDVGFAPLGFFPGVIPARVVAHSTAHAVLGLPHFLTYDCPFQSYGEESPPCHNYASSSRSSSGILWVGRGMGRGL